MKKITILLVIIFIFLFSTATWGEWIFDTKINNGKFYYDIDRIKKSGKFLYFWELIDLVNPTIEGGLSFSTFVQLDCSNLRYKGLKLQLYSGNMGEGEELDDYTPEDEWYLPKPNTSSAILYNKICEEYQLLIPNKILGGWNFILESGTGKKWYYDKDSVRNIGKYIHFWELLDYIKPSDGDLSSTRYTELDCSTLQYKTMKFHTYNKSMGEGELTYDYIPPDTWVYPKPNSIPEVMYKIICEENQ